MTVEVQYASCGHTLSLFFLNEADRLSHAKYRSRKESDFCAECALDYSLKRGYYAPNPENAWLEAYEVLRHV